MNVELKLRKDLMDFICSHSVIEEIKPSSTTSKRRIGSKSSDRKSSKSKSKSTKTVDVKPVKSSERKPGTPKPPLEKVIDFNNPDNVAITISPKKPPRPGSQTSTASKERTSIIALMPNIKWNFQKGEPESEIEHPKWLEPFSCNGRFEARYDILPMELIIKIFKQITPSDRLAAGSTCRRWMEASHYYEPFLDKTYYHFNQVEFGDQVGPFKYFSKGFRYYPRLTFTQVDFNKHSDFWAIHGLWITELTLRSCKIRKKKFISVMKNLLNLRRLELMQCDELFKTWPLEHNLQEPMFPFFLFCLRHLSLSGCDYFNEYHFERFITMAPNLRSVDVSNCFINLYLSKRITMLDRVMKLINKNRYLMSALNIADTPCVDDFTWHCLCEIEDLRLSHLTVAYCDRVPLKEPGIIRFLGLQTELTYLDLTSSTGINDECLQIIITSCPLLHTLKLRRCWLISDEGVLDMHTLQHLRVLDISNCERISDYGIMTGIVGKRPRELHELYLSILNHLTDSTLYYMMVTFKNIQILDLDSTTNCVTDASIQYIACYLQNLKQLNVVACTKITDAGFTGIDLPQKTFAIWDIEETFSIDRLKKLRILKVSGCYKITDFSLRYAFRFMELKELSISRCPQISKPGIEKLVTSCPALEFLDLSECPNINDYCVELIAMHLKRLSTLKLTNCVLVTEVGLGFLSQHCQNLKYLYVRGCFKLPSDIMERLSNITTLRQVYKS
ncbi:F-box and leucine-rich repeat protein 13-like isoform X1 [Topomyia yanbarensis]|uniref:F-box and leucine-rich repeat protein 13-like isoform X1 n=1 Tax=Topomyia yanbarensis TaxID=2498891 RepID=UPI00273AFECF|nr:F-box and leucine-rich repeat protein 13-like isoform X1 [Topomyia yanbarensis]